MLNLVYLGINASYAHSMPAGWFLKSALPGIGETLRWVTIEATPADDSRILLNRIVQAQPELLAVSVYVFNASTVYPLLRRVRKCLPGCIIVAGGPEFLGDNEGVLRREPALDGVVRGEGERAFARLVEVVHNRSAWSGIPGLCYLSGDVYRDGGWAENVAEADRIPSPYTTELAGFKKPFVHWETSRGCANRCAFCTSGLDSGVRFYSLDRIRADLEAIRRQGIHQVRLLDRTFNDPPKRALELLTLFQRDFPELAFHLEIDPARVTPEFTEGLRAFAPERLFLEVGIQTFRDATLSLLGRRGTVSEMRRGLALLSEVHTVQVHLDLVAGLPGVGWADLLQDLNEAVRLGPREIQLEILKILPGTELARHKIEWGILAADDPPYETLQTRDLTAAELVRAHRLSRLVDAYYNVEDFRTGIVRAVCEDSGFWENFSRFVEAEGPVGHCLSLENRYFQLDRYWNGAGREDRRRELRYGWLKRGFSLRQGLAAGEPWKRELPSDVECVEGAHSGKPHRIVRVVLDREYFFVYAGGEGGGRSAMAVYARDLVRG